MEHPQVRRDEDGSCGLLVDASEQLQEDLLTGMLNTVSERPYKTYLIRSGLCQNLSKSLEFSGILSKFQEIAEAADIFYIISRNLVKIRSNFIEIGAKNDEIAGNLQNFGNFPQVLC